VDRIIWAVNPLNDTLPRTANYLCEHVEMFLSGSSVRCRLDVLADLPDRSISSDIRHNIFLTVKESLNNVIKHGQATEVLFRLAANHAGLLIAIEDNGKGFAMSEVSSFANGLHNMEKRIKDIGGSFVLASAPGQGTRIRIQVPWEGGP
jgi:signal transduction histidine kinase